MAPADGEPAASAGDAEPEPKKKRRTRAVAAAGGEPVGEPGGEPDQAKIERQKKQSRKSAAYHRARKAALESGKTEEEAKAIGKEVTSQYVLSKVFPWFTYNLPFPIMVSTPEVNQSIFPHRPGRPMRTLLS